MELGSYLRHPVLDQPHLLEAKVETETVKDLFRRQLLEQAFEARDRRFDLGRLGIVDLRADFRSVKLCKIKACQKLKPDGTGILPNSLLEPFKETLPSRRGDPQHLARRKLFLLDHLRRDVAAVLQAFQDGICLALAQMPHLTQVGDEPLVQVITVAGTCE